MSIQINGDTAANYHWQIQTDGVFATGMNATLMHVGGLNGATATHWAGGVVDILNYQEAGLVKVITFTGTYVIAGDLVYRSGTGSWNTRTVAINRVTIFSDAATAQFSANSAAFLYGY